MRIGKFSANSMAYGETGQTKLENIITSRMVAFWHNLRVGKEGKISSILLKFLKSQFDSNSFQSKWCQKINNTLNQLGLSYIWNYEGVHMSQLKTYMKEKLMDLFIQNWYADIETNSLCGNYKFFKLNFERERYISLLDTDLKFIFAKFRCGAHNLPIADKRFNPIDERCMCPLCINAIGDEYHYLLVCPAFDPIRPKYLDEYYCSEPELYKFFELMNLKSKNKLIKLVKFINIIMYTFRP